MSIASQKTKKRNRSRAQNTPTIAVSRRSIAIWNSLTRAVIWLHAESRQSGVRKVVSRTSSRLIPSIPR